jgi:hypothetical protein
MAGSSPNFYHTCMSYMYISYTRIFYLIYFWWSKFKRAPSVGTLLLFDLQPCVNMYRHRDTVMYIYFDQISARLENQLRAIIPERMAWSSPYFNAFFLFDLLFKVTEVKVQNVTVSWHISLRLVFDLKCSNLELVPNPCPVIGRFRYKYKIPCLWLVDLHVGTLNSYLIPRY